MGTAASSLSDEQVSEVRDFLSVLAGIIVDAFIDLDNLDQNAIFAAGRDHESLNPTGVVIRK
jgi:hypothetical protein